MRTELWTEKLEEIYKDREIAEKTAKRIEDLVAGTDIRNVSKPLDEKDAILITYGDSIIREGEKPLRTLASFLKKYVGDAVSTVHILPFFPYTSDDGFSITDYSEVNPDLGDWDDVAAIAKDHFLMVDSVANHVSRESRWFQGYLQGDEEYRDFFIEGDPALDYSSVTRPRTSPLLTPFRTKDGEKYIWTTFSDDQIDLNYRNPEVLVRVMGSILDYVSHGARFIRLDAIGFIWKEMGTTCMHLRETHAIIKLIKLVLEDAAPGTMLITETNVPQPDNISYFGENGDEAAMVYQFPLPPLVMHTIISGDASVLTKWAETLYQPVAGTCYFNFLSSHDGIGLRPADGILSEEQKADLVSTVLRNGGRVSYKTNSDGSQSPYEMNISYIDALSGQYDSDQTRHGKMTAAMAVLLSLQGVPGIYIHSLLGTRNDYYGLAVSGIARRINREKLQAEKLEAELDDCSSLRYGIYSSVMHMLRTRKAEKAFSPSSSQQVLNIMPEVFALLRGSDDDQVLVLINVTGHDVMISGVNTEGTDLLTGEHIDTSAVLSAYQVMWIRK